MKCFDYKMLSYRVYSNKKENFTNISDVSIDSLSIMLNPGRDDRNIEMAAGG